MKHILLVLLGVLLLAACSTPKYAYYFDHYDYNSGKKKSPVNATAPAKVSQIEVVSTPLKIDETSVVASAAPVVVATPSAPSVSEQKSLIAKKYSSLTKDEKKAFRKEVKSVIKDYKKSKKSGESITETQVMDYNLKMAIIFGAVALTLSFFGGVNSVFWILSVVALVVGVVFFIKWIAEQ